MRERSAGANLPGDNLGADSRDVPLGEILDMLEESSPSVGVGLGILHLLVAQLVGTGKLNKSGPKYASFRLLASNLEALHAGRLPTG